MDDKRTRERATLLFLLIAVAFETRMKNRKIKFTMERNITSLYFYLIFTFYFLLERLKVKDKIIKYSNWSKSVVFFSITISLLCGPSLSSHTHAQGDMLSASKAKYFVALMRADYDDQDDLVELYSSYLTDGDIALSHPNEDNLEYTKQLPGEQGVQYFSLSEIMLNAASLKAQGVDIVSYDFEKGNASYHELRDPVASVRKASEVVHKNNMKFMISPSKAITADFGTQFAPFADIYNIQAQSLQTRPDKYSDFVEQTVMGLRSANPEISISVQISTARGALEGMKRSIGSVIDIVDGASSWYTNNHRGLDKLSSFVEWFDDKYRQEE